MAMVKSATEMAAKKQIFILFVVRCSSCWIEFFFGASYSDELLAVLLLKDEMAEVQLPSYRKRILLRNRILLESAV